MKIGIFMDFLQNKYCGDIVDEFESECMEFKESVHSKKTIKKSLCAFLNGKKTAYLICGINDTRRIIGISSNLIDNMKLYIDGLITDNFFFSDGYVVTVENITTHVVKLKDTTRVVLAIKINPPVSGDLFYIKIGKRCKAAYIRLNASNIIYTEDNRITYRELQIQNEELKAKLNTNNTTPTPTPTPTLVEVETQTETETVQEQEHSLISCEELSKTNFLLYKRYNKLAKSHEQLNKIVNQYRNYEFLVLILLLSLQCFKKKGKHVSKGLKAISTNFLSSDTPDI